MTAPGQRPLLSLQARAAVPAAARLSVRLVYLVSALSIVLLVAADLAIARLLRDSTLRSAEKTLADKAFILAEGAERTMQAADLVLGGVARHAVSDGADSPESFDAVMSTQNANTMLRDQMTGLPQLNALLVVSLSGHLENSTRYWPVPPIDIRDRGYFQKMMADPALDMMITEPLSARGDGTWTMFLVRRARGPSGHPIGLLMAAIELKYFEGFYRSFTRVGEGSTVLLTADGTMLARYPPMTGAVTGRRFADVPRILGDAGAGTAREPSAVDGSMRVKAARSLKTYPMIVLTIADEALLLRDWRRIILVLGLGTAAAAVAAMAVSLLIARRWRHHDALSQERENRALAEAALMREREHSAEAESRAKSDFLAMMSHEIRTPMNGVLGVAGTLLETPLSAQQRKMVTLIRDSGDSLLTILNDILDYSKLNADKMQLEEAPFSPAVLTQRPVSLLGPRAAAKGLTVRAVCADDLPEALSGDAGRIGQVLLNLASNALKFTDAGTITVRAVCPSRDTLSATIVWTVEDTGIGIAPDRLGSLFGDFVQADASIARRFGGSGLGLAISRRLVDRMGGAIAVESAVGAGSTFRVTLRLPLAEPAVERAVRSTDVAADFAAHLRTLGRTPRILIAEDNPTNQFVASRLLQGFDVRTDLAGDGLEAVHAASTYQYDAILMDVRMPEMDGLAATRAIRARGGRLASIPIVALTANAFPEDVAACLAAGMNDFVSKPVRKEILLAALLTAFGARPSDRPAAAAGFDLDGFAVLARDIGEDGVAALFETFEGETRARLVLLENSSLDRKTLVREVHSLKGAAGAVGASLLRDRAAALEARLSEGGAIDETDLACLRGGFADWFQASRAVIPADGQQAVAA